MRICHYFLLIEFAFLLQPADMLSPNFWIAFLRKSLIYDFDPYPQASDLLHELQVEILCILSYSYFLSPNRSSRIFSFSLSLSLSPSSFPSPYSSSSSSSSPLPPSLPPSIHPPSNRLQPGSRTHARSRPAQEDAPAEREQQRLRAGLPLLRLRLVLPRRRRRRLPRPLSRAAAGAPAAI